MHATGAASQVARDDFGQVGEIRPLKPKPFMLTAAMTTGIWIAGFLKVSAQILFACGAASIT